MLFQGCGHNPTGSDPTDEEWGKLSKLCKVWKTVWEGRVGGLREVEGDSCSSLLPLVPLV